MTPSPEQPAVVAVARDDVHRFSKPLRDEITLITGHGVEGDAHAGPTMIRRVRYKPTETLPNLRQVHLIQRELFDDLAIDGFDVTPGDLGENMTTTGIDLLALPRGTRIRLGDDAEVELTGLRNPCKQLDTWHPGLMKRLIRRRNGVIVRLAGVMAIVVRGGRVRPGDALTVIAPPGPLEPLERV